MALNIFPKHFIKCIFFSTFDESQTYESYHNGVENILRLDLDVDDLGQLKPL